MASEAVIAALLMLAGVMQLRINAALIKRVEELERDTRDLNEYADGLNLLIGELTGKANESEASE